MPVVHFLVLLGSLGAITLSQAVVFQPTAITLLGVQTANGSSTTGGCPMECAGNSGGVDVCDCLGHGTDFTNFLVDGDIPTIGDPSTSDDWASPLFTLERTSGSVVVGFNIDVLVTPVTVVITMFYCPAWNIYADTIRVYRGSSFPVQVSLLPTASVVQLGSLSLDNPSCNSLQTFYVPVDPTFRSFFYVEFAYATPRTVDTPREWVHLAEISFTDEIPTTTTPTPTTPSDTSTTSSPTDTEDPTSNDTSTTSTPTDTTGPTPTDTEGPTPTDTTGPTPTDTEDPIPTDTAGPTPTSVMTESTSDSHIAITIGTSETQRFGTSSSSVMSSTFESQSVTPPTSSSPPPPPEIESPLPTSETPSPSEGPMQTTAPSPTPQPVPTITIVVAVLVVVIVLLILLLVCGIFAVTCYLKTSRRSKRDRLEVYNLQQSILESQSKGDTAAVQNAFYEDASCRPTSITMLGYASVDPTTNGGMIDATYSNAALVQDENYATISEANNAVTLHKATQGSPIPSYAGIIMPEPPPVPEKSEAFLAELSSSVPNGEYSTVGHEGLATPLIRVDDENGPKLLRRPLCHSMIDNPDYQHSGVALSIFNSTENLDSLDRVYSEPSQLTGSIRSVHSGLNVNPIYSDSRISPEIFLPGESTQEAQEDDSEMNALYAPIYTMAIVPPEEHNLLEVSWDNLREVEVLGKGFFGEVVLADTAGLSPKDLKLSESNDDKDASVKVAVKKLRGGASKDTRAAFEKEFKFMSRLEHGNVIRILGVCTLSDTPFIMMEYMEKGDLNHYLQQYNTVVTSSTIADAERKNSITVGVLIYIATQIASAMKYLASHNFVHRDLATRNCLVGEEHLVKIADFGMSRNLYESHYYRVRGRAVLPVRWMAKECFYGKFSTSTDVWAFGVLVWEVFTLGKAKPYIEMTDDELVKDATQHSRKVLEKPVACPQEVYEIMLKCWRMQSSDRATFHELLDLFSSLESSDIFGDDAV